MSVDVKQKRGWAAADVAFLPAKNNLRLLVLVAQSVYDEDSLGLSNTSLKDPSKYILKLSNILKEKKKMPRKYNLHAFYVIPPYNRRYLDGKKIEEILKQTDISLITSGDVSLINLYVSFSGDGKKERVAIGLGTKKDGSIRYRGFLPKGWKIYYGLISNLNLNRNKKEDKKDVFVGR